MLDGQQLMAREWREAERDAVVTGAGMGWLVVETERQRKQHGPVIHQMIADAALADEYGIDDDVIAVDEFLARIRAGRA